MSLEGMGWGWLMLYRAVLCYECYGRHVLAFAGNSIWATKSMNEWHLTDIRRSSEEEMVLHCVLPLAIFIVSHIHVSTECICVSYPHIRIPKGELCLQFSTHHNNTLSQKSNVLIPTNHRSCQPPNSHTFNFVTALQFA